MTVLLFILHKHRLDLIAMKEAIRRTGKLSTKETTFLEYILSAETFETIFVRLPKTEKYLQFNKLKAKITVIQKIRRWVFYCFCLAAVSETFFGIFVEDFWE
ncbi:MAG: hypothetical protein ACFHU9_13980 [Fluviicola sp.]